MERIRYTILTIIIVAISTVGQARHIIGGGMTYNCTGTGTYAMTMKVYRDCAGGGAAFDSNGSGSQIGTVTVYLGDQIFIRTVNLSTPMITSVQAEDNPCLILPPGVCVEEGVYRFNLNLPVSSETYTIVYQRCCRNDFISNLVRPGEVGATFFVQITPPSQAICNDSPVFDDFPPIVICNNEDLIYNHSATDQSPNVQLVYSLCSPSIGGGRDGLDGNVIAAQSATGVAPNPDQPPPYDAVTYQMPAYRFDRPLGANPQLQIDPNTGIMTGRPNVTGQYVVGVCVQEFHLGILMSEIRRDFQFNVANCERLVFADLAIDDQLMDGTFTLTSCGDRTIEFTNQSTNVNFIDDYLWEFDILGASQTFDTRNVTVTFPDTGVFFASMTINPNSSIEKCRDTANMVIGVFGAIYSDFNFDYDTCVAGPVAFTSMASTENDRIVAHEWDFGDGNFSDLPNPMHTYQVPGTFDVRLTVRDNRGCEIDVVKPLSYFPIPAIVVAEPNRFIACTPGVIRFENISVPINDEYTVTWDFGDGMTDEGLSVEHTYENAGTYSVNIEIISPLGCQTDATFRNWILIKESPMAAFSYIPDKLNDLQREVFFGNQSQGADGYQWTFGDGGVAFVESPSHEYPDTGVYEVVLISNSSNGCTDTAYAIIDIEPLNTYFLPNAFSPNDDGLNDEFSGKGILKGMRQFSMTIWNRWGELVFESDDPTGKWNGQLNNNGLPAPKGVYHCKVNYIAARGEQREIQTALTLLR